MATKKNLPAAAPAKPPLQIPTQAALTAGGPGQVTINQVSEAVKQLVAIEAEILMQTTLLEKLNERKRILRQSTLPSVLESAGVKSVTLPGGETVVVEDFIAANITKENEAAAFKWLRANKAGALIKNEFKLSMGKGTDAFAKEVLKAITALNKKLAKKKLPEISVAKKASVNWQTLQAFVKEKLSAGKALPAEINVTRVPTASIIYPKEEQ